MIFFINGLLFIIITYKLVLSGLAVRLPGLKGGNNIAGEGLSPHPAQLTSTVAGLFFHRDRPFTEDKD
ncbi:hypothetical protein ACVGW2_14600, partial [Enterobacter intestinihominis]